MKHVLLRVDYLNLAFWFDDVGGAKRNGVKSLRRIFVSLDSDVMKPFSQMRDSGSLIYYYNFVLFDIYLICLQIAEKKLIEREFLEEEKRLNDLMENERRCAVKEELRKEQEEAARRLQFARTLKEQIMENEEQRILEFERKQEESRLISLNNVARQQDEIERMRGKEAESAKIRQELTEAHEQWKHFKAIEKEEEKIINLRYFFVNFFRISQPYD